MDQIQFNPHTLIQTNNNYHERNVNQLLGYGPLCQGGSPVSMNHLIPCFLGIESSEEILKAFDNFFKQWWTTSSSGFVQFDSITYDHPVTALWHYYSKHSFNSNALRHLLSLIKASMNVKEGALPRNTGPYSDSLLNAVLLIHASLRQDPNLIREVCDFVESVAEMDPTPYIVDCSIFNSWTSKVVKRAQKRYLKNANLNLSKTITNILTESDPTAYNQAVEELRNSINTYARAKKPKH